MTEADGPGAATTRPDGLSMRCVRRQSVVLNKAKAAQLAEVVTAYAKEKDKHPQTLAPALYASTKSQRAYRGELIALGYKSP